MAKQINLVAINMGHGPGNLVFVITGQQGNGGCIGRSYFEKIRIQCVFFQLGGQFQTACRGKYRVQKI